MPAVLGLRTTPGSTPSLPRFQKAAARCAGHRRLFFEVLSGSAVLRMGDAAELKVWNAAHSTPDPMPARSSGSTLAPARCLRPAACDRPPSRSLPKSAWAAATCRLGRGLVCGSLPATQRIAADRPLHACRSHARPSASCPSAVQAKGNAAFSSGNFPDAVEHFTAAIAVDPTNHVLYSNRSAAYASMSQYQQALGDAQKVVELKPDWPKGYSRLGAAQFGLRQWDEAVEAYTKGEQSCWVSCGSCSAGWGRFWSECGSRLYHRQCAQNDAGRAPSKGRVCSIGCGCCAGFLCPSPFGSRSLPPCLPCPPPQACSLTPLTSS